MGQAIDRHRAAQNHEHHRKKPETARYEHTDGDKHKTYALSDQKARGRHVHAPEPEDISRITFAAPVFFGDVNHVAKRKQPRPEECRTVVGLRRNWFRVDGSDPAY